MVNLEKIGKNTLAVDLDRKPVLVLEKVMKESLFDALTPVRQTPEDSSLEVNRRGFVKLGAAGLGVLAAASPALATFPRRVCTPVVEGPPLMQIPAEVPVARLTFEVRAGGNPEE